MRPSRTRSPRLSTHLSSLPHTLLTALTPSSTRLRSGTPTSSTTSSRRSLSPASISSGTSDGISLDSTSEHHPLSPTGLASMAPSRHHRRRRVGVAAPQSLDAVLQDHRRRRCVEFEMPGFVEEERVWGKELGLFEPRPTVMSERLFGGIDGLVL
ncbi:MAG: hypothetical protein M1825_004105 [Sarcosagium campestre]|nr:MAG: hypothetical protein M1825_004105 [Sarcosagium campestre]